MPIILLPLQQQKGWFSTRKDPIYLNSTQPAVKCLHLLDFIPCHTIFTLILVNFPKQINAIIMGLSIIYLQGSQVVISQLWCISVPGDCFTLKIVSTQLSCRRIFNYLTEGSLISNRVVKGFFYFTEGPLTSTKVVRGSKLFYRKVINLK